MSKNKSMEQKEKLSSEFKKNKRVPVWVYMRTKDRGMVRRRSRNWRFAKMKLKTPHKKAAIKRLKIIHHIRSKRR